MTSVHLIWNLHQGTQRQFGGVKGGEKKEEKKMYSCICFLGRIPWLMNNFKWWFPIIFYVVYWTSLWRVKLQRKNTLWRGENDLFPSQNKIKAASIPFTRLFHINVNRFTLFLNKDTVIDHFPLEWESEALKPAHGCRTWFWLTCQRKTWNGSLWVQRGKRLGSVP